MAQASSRGCGERAMCKRPSILLLLALWVVESETESEAGAPDWAGEHDTADALRKAFSSGIKVTRSPSTRKFFSLASSVLETITFFGFPANAVGETGLLALEIIGPSWLPHEDTTLDVVRKGFRLMGQKLDRLQDSLNQLQSDVKDIVKQVVCKKNLLDKVHSLYLGFEDKFVLFKESGDATFLNEASTIAKEVDNSLLGIETEYGVFASDKVSCLVDATSRMPGMKSPLSNTLAGAKSANFITSVRLELFSMHEAAVKARLPNKTHARNMELQSLMQHLKSDLYTILGVAHQYHLPVHRSVPDLDWLERQCIAAGRIASGRQAMIEKLLDEASVDAAIDFLGKACCELREGFVLGSVGWTQCPLAPNNAITKVANANIFAEALKVAALDYLDAGEHSPTGVLLRDNGMCAIVYTTYFGSKFVGEGDCSDGNGRANPAALWFPDADGRLHSPSDPAGVLEGKRILWFSAFGEGASYTALPSCPVHTQRVAKNKVTLLDCSYKCINAKIFGRKRYYFSNLPRDCWKFTWVPHMQVTAEAAPAALWQRARVAGQGGQPDSGTSPAVVAVAAAGAALLLALPHACWRKRARGDSEAYVPLVA
mmetsp:Transcript_142919/g.398221  ORF Transcript_142919/g.398221 Transcript_142919/m.398221 type:complete len:599 (+) Transcript_142919:2-1798(+)